MKKKITGQDVLNILAKTLNEANEEKKVTKNYVNPTAAALLTGAGYEVKKEDGSPLDIDIIEKMNILQEFNRNDQYSGQQAKERLSLVFNNSEFLKKFQIRYGDQLTIPIDMRASLPEQLTSTIRAGTQSGVNRQELGAVFGIELYLLHVELQKDIPIHLIRNNLYNPNFEQEIDEMLNTELANDFLRLATNGYSDSFSSIGADFYTLAIGHEKILETVNGSWTNSNGTSIILGRWGNKVTPNKVNIGSVTGISSANENPTAQEILSIFDALIDNHPHNYKNRKNVLIVSPEDYDLYVKARSMAVIPKDSGAGNATNDASVNTIFRENLTNTWIAPPYRGNEVIANPMKKYIGQSYSGNEVIPNVIYAPLEEFYIGAQQRIDQDRKYNARSESGGAAIEITKHFWIDFQIRNREACSIAFYGAKCETPVLADSNNIKADNFISGALTASTVVYPYCDTKGVRIFVGAATADQATANALLADLSTAEGALGTGDEATQELSIGEAYTLAEIGGAKTYFAFAAFKDGVLLRSDIVEVSLDVS